MILLCRMVRDNVDKTLVESREQNHAAETQSQSQNPKEPAGPEPSAERVKPNNQDPTEREPDLLHWNKPSLEEEPEPWRQVSIQSKCTLNHSSWILFLLDIDF